MTKNLLLDGINNVMYLKQFLCDQLHCEMEELDFKKVHNFFLEHKNLLKINCLWPMCNLTHLSLANNKIKKIENLESLCLLTELNLSFNEISKIENLNTLTCLSKLLLNSNRIPLLENLDSLKHLKILDVSSNLIKDAYFPFYLSQFKELLALVINDNPCYFQANEINEYLLALMPQLLDLNNRKVSEKEKYAAKIHHRMKVIGYRKIGFKDFDQPGTLFSKYKTLKKRRKGFCELVGEEFFDFLFENFKQLCELSDEGENFQRLNDRLKKAVVALFQELPLRRTTHVESIKTFEENVSELERKSLNLIKKYKSNLKLKNDNIENDGKESEETNCSTIRMFLLAEECNLYNHQQQLLNEMKSRLLSEIEEFYNCIKNIHKSIEDEICSYIKAMSKNIGNCYQCKTNNVPYEFQPNSGENIFYNVNLSEFFAVFKGNCLAILNESETKHIELLREWKEYLSKIEKKNVVRHRKAVAEIIKFVQSVNIQTL